MLPARSRGRPCFNPRPHAEGDAPAAVRPVRSNQFQPTPSRGGRRRTWLGSWRAPRRFNPRPHAEGDPSDSSALSYTRRFQPTPSRGGRRQRSRRTPGPQSRFNPRPHAEGDLESGGEVDAVRWVSTHALTRRATPMTDGAVIKMASFQPTPSRGGRPETTLRWGRCARCFNPRPHAEGDTTQDGMSSTQLVSTHALTRRATGASESRLGYSAGVSTHALTRRATRPHEHHAAKRRKFQPTPSRGGRRRDRPAAGPDVRVSTHALTRRATKSYKDCAALTPKFQPTPSRGGRHSTALRGSPYAKPFQPTPSRGGRPDIDVRSARVQDGFNPRPHAEGDVAEQATRLGVVVVSTHALTRRATGTSIGRLMKLTLFQPTPSRGGRPGTMTDRRRCGGCFNPRPHAEGDGGQRFRAVADRPVSTHALTRRATNRWMASCRCGSFQPTPSRGGRPASRWAPVPGVPRFQPTPSRGGRPPGTRPWPTRASRFNPRPHAEGDDCRSVRCLRPGVSTHALTRRAT